MSDHVSEWLSSYLDGELHGSRLERVNMHVAECDACRAELASLEKISNLLQEVPSAAFTPPERFAAQVRLRLPHQRTVTPGKKLLEISWWMIPVGLLTLWIFINTSFFIYDALSVVNNFGLLTGVSPWMRFGILGAADWSSTLGQIGILEGNSLALAASTETFTRASLTQITLQVSIALLYLSWIAIWWAHYQHQQRTRPLEN
ncbi:MAG TPA: zf-HC2 domain-containing protein [Anaerolineales bacterium]|nr:zf-HC2 domain-containing protein [Anaerolineales bacterium]